MEDTTSTRPPQRAMPPAISGFEPIEQIYQSAKTVVVRAVSTKADTSVVIKFLRNEFPDSEEVGRLRNEYEVGNYLNAPCLVPAKQLIPHNGSFALVCEDVGAVDLNTFLQTHGPLSVQRVVEIALRLTDCLEHLTQHRVLHCDINPTNILIHPETHQVWLTDFGAASLLPAERQELDRPKSLAGTLAYMAPEQTGAMDRVIDHRADLYGVGATLYELLTGCLPFNCDDPIEVLHCLMVQSPTPPSNTPTETHSEVPEALSNIIMKLLAGNPDQRYQTVSGLKHDFQQCSDQLRTSQRIEPFEPGQEDSREGFPATKTTADRQTEIRDDELAFYFYDSLTILASCGPNCDHHRNELDRVEQNQAKLRTLLSHGAAADNQHRFDLIEAERFRALDQKLDAMEFYDLAIVGAKAKESTHEEALANELAGRFYVAWGRDNIAAVYLHEAYHGYRRWGATGKTEHMERCYASLLAPILKHKQLLSPPHADNTLTDGEQLKYAAKCPELQREHNQLKATLEATNQRLNSILQCSSMGTWEWSFADNRLTWDAQMFEIYGVDPDNFRGTYADWASCLHPDDLARMIELEQCQTKTASPAPDEFRIVRPDGEVRHIYVNIFFEKDERGELVRTVGINFDITERRKAELALQDAQSQFRRTTENVPGMIYRYVRRADGSPAMTFVTAQCRELFEIEPEDAIESFDSIFKCIHPDDIQSMREATDFSAENLTPFKQEFRVILPTQGLCWRQAIAQPTKADNGDLFYDGVAIDITHRKRTELQLKLANEQLASATKMKDEFLANMSHELRTPLNAILGMTEGLQEGIFGPVNERQLDSYRVIEQSGAHLLTLINEVLDLAKIESGSMDLNLSRVNPTQLCESSMQLVQQQAAKKSIQLKLNTPPDLPDFEADRKRLRQVLVNLLSNAVKFTPNKGLVQLDVALLADEKQRHQQVIRLSVSDNGIGIEASNVEKVFDPFVQVDSALNRNYTGTGLGLSLVKRFVELHAGRVSVTSELGVGSCFRVDLPLRLRPDSIATSSRRHTNSPGKQTSHESREPTPAAFILLAEDNELIAKATIGFLEASDFRVELAADGGAAIEAAQHQSPDVILMDVQMPGIDGLEAIQRIRQMPEHKETPIIALTGLAMQSDADRCLAAGANQYLSKPYGMQQLVDLIRQQLRQ